MMGTAPTELRDDFENRARREIATREQDIHSAIKHRAFLIYSDVGCQDARNHKPRRADVPEEGVLGYACGYDEGLANLADFDAEIKRLIAGRIAAAIRNMTAQDAAHRAVAIAELIVSAIQR